MSKILEVVYFFLIFILFSFIFLLLFFVFVNLCPP